MQWGLEYWILEYPTHWNAKCFVVLFSNGQKTLLRLFCSVFQFSLPLENRSFGMTYHNKVQWQLRTSTIWNQNTYGPFEIQPSKGPDFECFRILNGQISDPHCVLLVQSFKYWTSYTRFNMKLVFLMSSILIFTACSKKKAQQFLWFSPQTGHIQFYKVKKSGWWMEFL